MRDTRSPTGRGEYCLRRPNVSLFMKMARNMNGKTLILEFGEISFSLAAVGNNFGEQFVFFFLFDKKRPVIVFRHLFPLR